MSWESALHRAQAAYDAREAPSTEDDVPPDEADERSEHEMRVILTCPACGATYSTTRELLGTEYGDCDDCGGTLVADVDEDEAR